MSSIQYLGLCDTVLLCVTATLFNEVFPERLSKLCLVTKLTPKILFLATAFAGKSLVQPLHLEDCFLWWLLS